MNLVENNFELFSSEYIKKHQLFFDSNTEFQKLLKLSSRLSLRPKNVRSYNVEVSEHEMNQIEECELLLTPSIFKDNNKLNVTIKKIEINADPLIFGVDISPLQIRLENFTEEDIYCEFKQTNEDLPLPRYRNEFCFLIIEIPVELICNSALKYTKKDEESSAEKQEIESLPTQSNKNKFIDIEETFVFEGVIILSTKDDSITSFKIEYQISLHYISLTAFISIKNNHFFAFNDETVEIVPFLAGPNSKLIFEKFTDKAIRRLNMLDNIIELSDNKAKKPEFQSRNNLEDDRVIDITTAFLKEDKKENSYLSMNYEFGLTKEQTLQATLHINTLPRLSKIGQLTLAILCDSTRNFVDKDALVNVGNLKRKVYFFVGMLNTSDEPISPENIDLYAHNYYIQAEYNSSKNTNTIPPNQYGYAIYYFESIYTGYYPFPNKDISDASITVTINGIQQTLPFKYKINAIENLGEKFEYNISVNDSIYYDQKKESFIPCDIRNIYKDPIFQNSENQLLITPFCYSCYDKSNLLTRVDYDHRSGTLAKLFFDRRTPIQLELFGFFPESRRFMVITVDKPEKISIRDRNVYILARIKDDPSTFFPLFCPMINNDYQFDARKCSDDAILRTFIKYFQSTMPTHDVDVRKPFMNYSTIDYLFDQTPLPSVFNFSYIIDLLGKGRKQISFKEVVPTIVRFTNNYEFRDHYVESTEKHKIDNSQFYSFISALNELIVKRYEHLQITNYYLKLPFQIETIVDKQNELIRKFILNEDGIDNIKYIEDFKNNVQNINDIEKNEINRLKESGYQISQILEWTEFNGITSSTMEELNAHKEKKMKTYIKINTIKDKNSNITTSDIKFIDFPEKITINSLYEKFKEILASTYNLPFIIYSLKKSHQKLNKARVLLNQLIAVFFWQNECSICFPFSSFSTLYDTAFSSMMKKLNNSNLRIMNFPIGLLTRMGTNDFVQIPSLDVSNINYPKFIQPGRLINFIEFKPTTKKLDNNNNNRRISTQNDINALELAKTSKQSFFEEITDLHEIYEYKQPNDSNLDIAGHDIDVYKIVSDDDDIENCGDKNNEYDDEEEVPQRTHREGKSRGQQEPNSRTRRSGRAGRRSKTRKQSSLILQNDDDDVNNDNDDFF